MANKLEELNQEIEEKIEKIRDEVIERREQAGYFEFSQYFISALRQKILLVNSSIENIDNLEVEFIDRSQFGADITVKVPKLLKTLGAERYIKEVVPVLHSNISNLPKDEIVAVEAKGIYVNVRLADRFLFKSIVEAVRIGSKYGESDFGKKRSIVVDYSSPNVAKHLHAGHIRSTIIGEVLSNIYEATGYIVHRLNYINDWGGMGYMIEGYTRWQDRIPKFESKNDELYFVYQIYRKGEKIYKQEEVYNTLTPSESDLLANFFGDFGSFSDFQQKFLEFKSAAEERFRRLEEGNEPEFSTWKDMRAWSLSEFNEFYDLINIHQDYLVGESFYARRGDNLVTDKLSTREIILFTKELAKQEIEATKKRLASSEITETVFNKLEEEIENDIGAYVVLLSGGKRLVVKKSSGATIYATRDLAGIEHRVKTFNPGKMVYEVGEEQTEYFRDLFEAADALNLTGQGEVALIHAAHGFYIDAETGKKLSSREGVEGVIGLIEKSIKYFRGKYEMRGEPAVPFPAHGIRGEFATKETAGSPLNNKILSLSDEEKDKNSIKLAIGSIAFNDIKQDKRFSLPLYKDAERNIKIFEESGGAYIMYSLARGKSILRKIDSGVSVAEVTRQKLELNEDEIKIVKLVSDFPRTILKASSQDNPAILTEFLLTLSNKYNGYYEKYRVLGADGGVESPHMVSIHRAVTIVLEKGLKLCHADPPEII